MKRAFHGNDPEPLGVALVAEIFTGEFDGRLVRFSPAVRKKGLPCKGMLHEMFRQFCLGLGII